MGIKPNWIIVIEKRLGMENVVKVNAGHIRQIIAEEKRLLAEYDSYASMLLIEGNRLREEGYTTDQINEGLMDIIKNLGGGFIETFKYQATIWLLSKFGMDPNGFLARAIANVVENMDVLEFRKYFAGGEAGCRELANLIMDSLAETGMEPLINGFVGGLGVNPDGRIYASVREAITNALLDGTIAQGLEDGLTDIICGASGAGGGILDVFKGSVQSTGGGGQQQGILSRIGSALGF